MHLLPRKNWCQVIRSAAPAMQHHFSKPEDLMLQNATHLRKSAPGPPNISDKTCLLHCACHGNASLQILFKCSMPAIVLDVLQNPHVLLTFGKVQNPLRLPRKTTSKFQKWSEHVVLCTFWLGNVLHATTPRTFFDISTPKSAPRLMCFLHFDLEMCFTPQRHALFRHVNFQKWSENGLLCYILTSKCALRHNGVHFFDISTSKSAPRLRCFVHFDLEICFTPQRRALFRHVNFQKWSENGLVCTFWLGNVLRATTACTVSTSQLPKGFQRWGDFSFFTAKVLRATRACNFLFLIWPDRLAPAALASPLFDPPEPQIMGKTPCFATFLPFRAPASSFFWLFLFSDLLSSSLLFSFLTLPTSAFPSVHTVGILTSKLPSIIFNDIYIYT